MPSQNQLSLKDFSFIKIHENEENYYEVLLFLGYSPEEAKQEVIYTDEGDPTIFEGTPILQVMGYYAVKSPDGKIAFVKPDLFHLFFDIGAGDS